MQETTAKTHPGELMQEIERKFLVRSEAFKQEASKQYRISQGYLSIDPERTVRVRIRDDKGFLTIKGKSSKDGTTRTEVEFEIAFAKAQTLLSLCLPGVIDKTRYLITQGQHLWEVDEFYDANQGLTLAEIELTTADEAFEIPTWIDREVTGQNKYYNAYLSKHPYQNWPEP